MADPWHKLAPGDPFDAHDGGQVFSGTVIQVWCDRDYRRVVRCRVKATDGRVAEINLLGIRPSTEQEKRYAG